MNSNDLRFPILCISHNDDAVVIQDRLDFELVSLLAVKRDYYKELRVITIDGGQFIVESLELVERISIWKKINPFINQRVRAALKLKTAEEQLNFSQLIELVVGFIRRVEGFNEIHFDIEERIDLLKNCKSLRDLFHHLWAIQNPPMEGSEDQ